MFFQHVYDKTLAQGSYIIGCQATGESIVIDAKRDIKDYLQIAKENGLKITHITETHIHADFLCGSRELAAATGAKVYLSEEGGKDWGYEFAHEGLKEGDIIKVGNLSLEVWHTPGHTPESISFLLTDHPAGEEPVMVFTGDFVFVGDVGRPDLLEEAAGIRNTKKEAAKQMFASLKRFMKLPDFVQVWPGHGAGSACGKALGAVPSSTVGYEKKTNWALQLKEEEVFVQTLLEGQPEPPKYFAMMKHLNKVDRPLLMEESKVAALSEPEFLSAYQKGIKVIDTRDSVSFGFLHFPGSINIQNKPSFATWMGWIMDYQEQFILIAGKDEVADLNRKLMRIGLDNIYGYFSEGKDLLWEMGESSRTMELFGLDELKEVLDDEDVQIVDVRGKNDYQSGHIKGAKNLFVGTMENHLDQLDKNKRTVVHCQSGMRSAIAYSILKKHGFKEVENYGEGMDGWLADGGEVVE